jgi:hypothetical protein
VARRRTRGRPESTHTDTFLPSFQPLPTVTEKCDVYCVACERFRLLALASRANEGRPSSPGPPIGAFHSALHRHKGGWGNNTTNQGAKRTASTVSLNPLTQRHWPPHHRCLITRPILLSVALVASLILGRRRRDRHESALHICFEKHALVSLSSPTWR